MVNVVNVTTPDLSKLEDSLRWLAARGYLSGSLGRGEPSGKDIDVRLADSHVKALKRLLNAQKVHWDSPFMGCITWWPEGVQVETAFLFPRYRTGDRIIRGVLFRT